MKAIIYAGISLLSVAAVYGLVDYYGSQKSGTLEKLYTEEDIPGPSEPTTTVIPAKNIEAVSPGNPVNSSTREPKKKRASSKKVKADDFSRGRIEETVPVDMIIEAPVKKEEEKIPVKIIEPVSEPVIITKEPVRELNLEKFSRAPLKAPRNKSKKIKII